MPNGAGSTATRLRTRATSSIFDWDGGAPDHVGLVEHAVGRGRLATVEGNTGVGNDSNGGEVMRRERRWRRFAGFGRQWRV